MELKQTFNEEDLLKLTYTFSRVMKSKMPKWIFWENKKVKKVLLILAAILLMCSITSYILVGKFSDDIKIYILIAGIIIGYCIFLEILKKLKYKRQEKVVKDKFSIPFSVLVENEYIIYKEISYSYKSITEAIESNEFLFIKSNSQWLVFKAEEKEKQIILETLKQYVEIEYI